MASRAEYRDFLLDQLAELREVDCRTMMGEYILYYRGRIFGGIYDDRLLVKPVAAARTLLPHAPEEQPYPGAKPMLLIEDVDDRAALATLVEALYEALPAPRSRRKWNG